jgi:hypothetical protein
MELEHFLRRSQDLNVCSIVVSTLSLISPRTKLLAFHNSPPHIFNVYFNIIQTTPGSCKLAVNIAVQIMGVLISCYSLLGPNTLSTQTLA